MYMSQSDSSLGDQEVHSMNSDSYRRGYAEHLSRVYILDRHRAYLPILPDI
jgi:hypothetical protein